MLILIKNDINKMLKILQVYNNNQHNILFHK